MNTLFRQTFPFLLFPIVAFFGVFTVTRQYALAVSFFPQASRLLGFGCSLLKSILLFAFVSLAVLTTSHAAAFFTLSCAVGGDVQIFTRQRMSAFAVRLARIHSSYPDSSKHIRLYRHSLHVVWIHAQWITAQMVNLQSIWNRPFVAHVVPAMGENDASRAISETTQNKCTIAFTGSGSSPFPTAIITHLVTRVESLFQWCQLSHPQALSVFSVQQLNYSRTEVRS